MMQWNAVLSLYSTFIFLLIITLSFKLIIYVFYTFTYIKTAGRNEYQRPSGSALYK